MRPRSKTGVSTFTSIRDILHRPNVEAGLTYSYANPVPQLVACAKSIDYWTDRNKRSFKPCVATRQFGPGYDILAPIPGDLSQERLPIRAVSGQLNSVAPDGRLTITRPRYYYWYHTQQQVTVGNNRTVDEALYDAYLVLRSGLTVPKGQNWLRSAIELKDTKNTIQGVVDFVKFGVRMPGMINARWRVMSIMDVAKAYLTYKFGIQPTASDCRAFLKGLSKGSLQVRGVKRHYRKGEVLRVGVNIRPAQSALLAASGWNGPREEQSVAICGHSSPWGSYSCAAYPSVCGYNLKQVKATTIMGCIFGRIAEDIKCEESLADDLEWSCPLGSTAWELTPFSFLLDWVVDVGSVIERLDRTAATMNSKISFVEGVWQSLRVTDQIWYPSPSVEVSCIQYGGNYDYPYDWTQWYHVNHRVVDCTMESIRSSYTYERKPYVIDGSALVPSFRWPIKGYQLSTGMALILANLKLARGAQLWKLHK